MAAQSLKSLPELSSFQDKARIQQRGRVAKKSLPEKDVHFKIRPGFGDNVDVQSLKSLPELKYHFKTIRPGRTMWMLQSLKGLF